jgi:ribose-phosphate pyrophosphokinase
LTVDDISLISGPSSSDLANKIANHLGVTPISAEVCIFTDGESKIRLPHFEKKTCVIVQSTYPPTDRHLLQAMMMIRKCSETDCTNIIAVIPYLAYARQDREFLPGEVVTMSVIARLLESVGVKHLITVDAHSTASLSHFRISVHNVSSIPLFARYAEEMLNLEKPVIVSPDFGGASRAASLASILKTDFIALNKNRDRSTGEVKIDTDESRYQFGKKDVIILDDIISTGDSIVKAYEALRRFGSSGRIVVMCTHALLINNATQKIMNAGVENIVATNSIPNKFSTIDLSPIICSPLRNAMSMD